MKDYGNGYSIEELAAKYRLSVRTCYRALDDAKQEARIQLAQVEDARKAEILAAYKNSVPLKEMIAKFNVNEKALMPSVMFAIYIDGIYYANRGMYVDDATTINCEYSLNEEVLSHYDPNFVKGL